MKRLVHWIITCACLALIVGMQYGFDHTKAEVNFKAEQKRKAINLTEPLVPSLTAMRLISLGQPQMAADVLWLQTIQYFGGGSPYGKYRALGPMLDTITQLDPTFQYPYEFGMIVLPFMGQTDTAITLGERSQSALPNNGLLDFYHASNYMLNVKDYRKAAYYYEKASKEPGAPGAAASLAGVALTKVNDTTKDRLAAVEYWKAVYENAKNDSERERAKNWYVHMEIVYQLEEAALAYKEKNGSFPPSLDTLVTAGVIKEIPISPIGRLYKLDPNSGRISFEEISPTE